MRKTPSKMDPKLVPGMFQLPSSPMSQRAIRPVTATSEASASTPIESPRCRGGQDGIDRAWFLKVELVPNGVGAARGVVEPHREGEREHSNLFVERVVEVVELLHDVCADPCDELQA